MKKNAPIKIKRFSEYAVLVVDDQPSYQVMLKNILADLGFYNVTTLSTADECKKACNTRTYNIYLFDYNLGHGENGRQLLIYLHKRQLIPADSIVFIITGDATRPMVLSALEQEPDDYIIKPISLSILQKRLFKIMEQKKDLKQLYEARFHKKFEDVITIGKDTLQSRSKYDHLIRIMVAEAMISSNKLQEAEDLISEGLAFENSLEYKLILSRIFSLQERYSEAEELLKEIIRKKTYNITAYKMLYDIYRKQNNLEEAVRIIDQAVDLSPQSTTLLRMKLEINAIQRNYLRMRDCVSSLMDLHKFEMEKLTNLLSGFAQIAILFAIDSTDPYHIGMLRKTVKSAIRKYMPFLSNSGKIGFNLSLFNEIIEARMDIATGYVIKGKKGICKSLSNMAKEDIQDLPDSIFSNIVAGLAQLGEDEYIRDLLVQRPDKVKTDDILSLCIHTCEHDPKIVEKKRKYEEINQEGITSYKDGDYLHAIQCFDEALRRSPGNTSASINKAQSLLRLYQKKNIKRDEKTRYLLKCRSVIEDLEGAPLTPEQTSRLEELKNQTENEK